MIGYLSGNLKLVQDNFYIIEVQGVGYRVEPVGLNYLENQSVEIYVYTYVRENEIRLFGFDDPELLEVFEKLLSVSGIGPKAAVSVLSTMSLESFLAAIEAQDSHALKVPGVGVKTAQKVILELKNSNLIKEKKFRKNKIDHETLSDAILALEGLGYKKQEVEQVISTLVVDPAWESEDIIKLVLSKL